jgi:hypothetical protein
MSSTISKKRRPILKYRFKSTINERIHHLSTGEIHALVIKTLWVRKQIAQPQGMCQSFSLEQRPVEILAAGNIRQVQRRILPNRGAVLDCEANYKGRNHEPVR